MNEVVSRVISILSERFKVRGGGNFNLNEELNILDPVSERRLTDEEKAIAKKELLAVIKYKESHDGAILVPVSTVANPREHEEWYNDWFAENNDPTDSFYWKRLENFLSRELTRKYGPERAGRVVKSIDEATFNIMEHLANPVRDEFSYKGLVVGYVQSGKTANFTALIAKAADAGYKLIIVLAGIHSVLRRQTQVRLDRELTGIRDIDGPDNYIPRPGAAKEWNRLTTAHNDFTVANLGLFSGYCQSATPTLAVVKKNVSVLNRLIAFISEAPEDLRANVPVLIIDDEADQASIDTNANSDNDPSRTNECIRVLLRQFPRKTYVGYTATPFANVLIDMSVEHDALEDDLYPRSFITSLPEPEGYFGTSTIFLGDLSERFIQIIPEPENEDDPNEIETLIDSGMITENLCRAIDEFILSCAIRNLRGDRMKPMSMLIHVSHKIIDMGIVKRLVSNQENSGYLDLIKERYSSTNATEKANLKREFQEVWTEFIADSAAINTRLGLTNQIPSFDNVWTEMQNVFDILRAIELNSASEDTLDYTTGEEIKVIAIGGNQLSRGLTLEGLMTSYYLRASRQYDTLLQMGRWFGYRQRYEDLTRIHTTEQISGFFEHLALVEDELRSEIYRYEEEEKTPLELAVAIRDHRNLSVTAPNKMGAGRDRQISYSDSLNQTIWFPLNEPDTLRANYDLGEGFIQGIQREHGFTNVNNSGVHLANQKIDGNRILSDFLSRYRFVDRQSTGGPGLDHEKLLTYVARRLADENSELNNWSVAIVGNVRPSANNTQVTFGNIPLNRIQRSRKHTANGYNIGVLTEPDHLKIDLAAGETRSSQNPLLLLYLIWKDSEAREQIPDNRLQFNQRINLYRFINTERVDVLGLAVVLPQSEHEPNSYIGQ